jgi:DNA-binding MarR family transcriptional regulator
VTPTSPAQDPRAEVAAPAHAAAEPVRWLDDQEQLSWRAFLRGYYLLMEALDRDLAEFGLRMSEWEILILLSEAPQQRQRMSALADLVVQSRSRLTHAAKRLEAAGVVQRSPVRGDGRGVELALTAAGQELVTRIAPSHVHDVRRRLVDLMSAQEMETLGVVMRRVILANRTSEAQGQDAFE